MRNILLLVLAFLLAGGLPACQTAPVYTPPPDWKYADLRLLDPAEDLPPSLDLVALYVRRLDEDIEIRLDLMDLPSIADCNLQIWLSSSTKEVIFTIYISKTGQISASNNLGGSLAGLRPRVTRDTFLDTVVVSLNRSSLHLGGLPFWVKASSMGAASSAGDEIGWVRSDAPPPPPVQVLFTFWNTFPAATPAQALRLWDGAHSGPGRSRFGLRHLLSASKTYHAPVFLLDLKSPTALSILDFMGVLPEIRSLAEQQLAILPDVTRYEIPADGLLVNSVSGGFDIPATRFLFTSHLPESIYSRYQVLFLPTQASEKLHPRDDPSRWRETVVLTIPQEDEFISYQATSGGPSLALRQDLIRHAAAPGAAPFYLGGPLANTTWGDPACVSPTLRYLTAHPWIRFLTADDLLTLHPANNATTRIDIEPSPPDLPAQIRASLQDTPANSITDQAWQTYLSLLTPASPELTRLRAGYFGIVGHLLTAAHWAELPGSLSDCSIDLDWDGQAECVLISPDFFASFELSGAYIVTAFARRAGGIHQIIAPYGEFVVGLGDPATWDPSRGSEGDPALVPGGFIDLPGPWIPEVQDGQIAFKQTDTRLTKTFRITPSGLRVEYTSASSMTVQISIGLDPWRRFSSGWGDNYAETTVPGGWEWALESGPQVSITTSGTLESHPFTASRPHLAAAEDPNFTYPAGHFIPFPLALVEINGQGEFFIEMDIR
jgi:hypothetical protein